MVRTMGNGKLGRWLPEYGEKGNNQKLVQSTKSDTTSGASSLDEIEQFELEIEKDMLRSNSSWWLQYKLLLKRMLTQMWRDKVFEFEKLI